MQTIGKYKILRELGSGGFGAVYLAEDPHLGGKVAIKVFQIKDPASAREMTSATGDAGEILKKRFLDEARILRQLKRNPNVVDVLEFDTLPDGRPYYIMPYLPKSLVDLIGRDAFTQGKLEEIDSKDHPHSLPVTQTLDILKQTLSGLKTVHEANLVHRDIKPANLLIENEGQLYNVVLCDFGIAKMPDGEDSKTGVGMGSPNYVSPEQRESAKHVDARSDVFSVGVLAYRMLTGTVPMMTGQQAVKQFLPGISDELNQLVMNAIHSDPNKRPINAGDFLHELNTAAATFTESVVEGEGTGTFVGTEGVAGIKDELKPLRDQLLKLLETHGDIPEEEIPALHITANMVDLDEKGLKALIEEVFITNQNTLKPKRKLRELIKKRASTGQSLSEGEYQAYLTQITNMGWNEAKLKGFLNQASLRFSVVKNETTAKLSGQHKAKDKTTAKPKDGVLVNKSIGALLVLVLLIGGVWLSKSTNTPKPIVKDSEVNLNEPNVKSQTPLVEQQTPKKQALINTVVGQTASQQTTPIKTAPIKTALIKAVPIRTTPKQKTPSTFPVTIATLPRNAKVKILTIQAKYYAGIKIPAKAHRIKVSKTGYISKTLNYDVTAPLSVTITLEKVPFYELEQALDLVSIPAGSFQMGSEDGDNDEKPFHRVTIPTFKMMAKELTWAQYQPCIDAGVCSSNGDAGFGKGNRPVINVSWDNAQIYATWLSSKTGKHYRLPSESEWEYTARAGSTTKYSLGNVIHHDLANYGTDECCDGKVEGKDKWLNTSPVGSFKANAFGVYDMHGNVFEWIQDCYRSSYLSAVSTNKALDRDDCTRRVLRGGSWRSKPDGLRSAVRDRDTASKRNYDIGFRLVQSR
mgnify:CR=1 FL=1